MYLEQIDKVFSKNGRTAITGKGASSSEEILP